MGPVILCLHRSKGAGITILFSQKLNVCRLQAEALLIAGGPFAANVDHGITSVTADHAGLLDPVARGIKEPHAIERNLAFHGPVFEARNAITESILHCLDLLLDLV